MLVLTRKCNQKIRIGEDVFITIFNVDEYGTVKLGIEAPKNVAIWRTEIDQKQGAKTG